MLVRDVPDSVLGSPARAVAAPSVGVALEGIAREVERSGGPGVSVVYSVSASREFHQEFDADLFMRSVHARGDSFALPVVCPTPRPRGVPVDPRVTASWTAAPGVPDGQSGEGQWLVSVCPQGVDQSEHEVAITLLWDALERGEALPVHDAYAMASALLAAPVST